MRAWSPPARTRARPCGDYNTYSTSHKKVTLFVSFRPVPLERKQSRNGTETITKRYGNDHEMVRIRCHTRTFRTIYFYSYHLICTRNSCVCAVRACKLVKYWLHVCSFLWGLPNYLWLQVTAKRNKLTK